MRSQSIAAVLAAVLGGAALLWDARSRASEAFDTDGRIMHRLLSQQVVQNDAVLATLALLAPAPGEASQAPQRLPALYPQVLNVQRRGPDTPAPDATWAAQEARSRQEQRAVADSTEFPHGRYRLLLARHEGALALQLSLPRLLPAEGWPELPASTQVQLLAPQGARWQYQAGEPAPGGWNFQFEKALASPSQPFVLQVRGHQAWWEWPWGRVAAWAVAVAAAHAALQAWRRQAAARRRAEELLRLGQVARLNTLGELAAGMAHELNNPLAAVLANNQAAQRLLAEDPPDTDLARQALVQAVLQARRATEVLGRLPTPVERPGTASAGQPLGLQAAARSVLSLLAPESQRLGVQIVVTGAEVSVLADRVSLEQVLHNLLRNALSALEQVPRGQRRLALLLDTAARQGRLRLQDTGPGIPPDLLPRLFEPFVSGRPCGLGLGLSLCDTLVGAMGGHLTAANLENGGAEFTLTLPLASLP